MCVSKLFHSNSLLPLENDTDEINKVVGHKNQTKQQPFVWPLSRGSVYIIIGLLGNLKHFGNFSPLLKTFVTWSVLRFMLPNTVFLTVIMPPFLALQGLQLLFNQPVCMNPGTRSPHIVSAACCLPACCEPDTTSCGPYTKIWRLG